MSLLSKIQELLSLWFPNKTEDQSNFNNWLDEFITYKNGKVSSMIFQSNISNVSDLRSYYLDDMINPFLHNCPHSITYDNNTEYTRIRINEGNTYNTGSRYYMSIPFIVLSNNVEVSVDFYTSGMGNDDFGIRICDKEILDNTGAYNSYGAWIITGQGRLAYGYGGMETASVKYGDYLGSIGNNILYNYTMKINDTTAYYCLKRLDNNGIISEKTYTRTDNYNFSGKYYLYIGGGKFSSGSADKSVYIKNLTVKELM